MQPIRLIPIVLVLLCGLPKIALASLVSLTPVRIHLSASKRSEVLVLHNTGKTAARFQFAAHTWQETPDGQMKLVPSDAILFFPSLLEIKAGQTRRIRMASTLAPGQNERSYRLVASELPEAGRPGVVQVLTKLNIPVFVQAARAPDKALLSARMEKGRVVVSVVNAGNSYFKARSVHLVARSSNGAIVFQRTEAGWYVLAHGRRDYRFEPPSGKCAAITSIVTTLHLEKGKVSTVAKVPPGPACGR